MVQIIERRPSFGEQFGRALGTGAGAGLQQGLQSRQDAKKLAGENESAMRLEEFKQNLIGNRERQKEGEARNERLNMAELEHFNAKELQEEKYRLEGLKEKEPKKSKYEETREVDRAKKTSIAEDTLMDNKNLLKDFDRIEKLSKTIAGPSGYLYLLGKDASELDALGTSTLKNVIKLFNPVGAIPVAKLNFIKDKHGISKWDTIPQIQGKLNALRKYSKVAIERSNQWIAIMDKYNGNPPPEVMQEFYKMGEAIADELEKEDNNSEDMNSNENQGLSGKLVDVVGPDGQDYEIDESEVGDLPEGYSVK